MKTLWILGAVFTVVGLPFILLARRAFARDRVVAQWPRVEGVVTSTKLGTSTHRIREKTGIDYYRTMYTPFVCYTYTINGQSFEGTGIARSIDGFATTKDSAQAVIDRYPASKQVMVQYDPADPKVAYLERGRSTGAVILLVFGLFWIAVAALLVGLSFV